jgi:hypothetical protein
MKLTMNRRGEFQCNWLDTHNKCGVGPDTYPRYTYHCHIETADILDAHGFVFDQLEIDNFFKKKYAVPRSAQSCERIAVSACEEIKRMIENHMLGHSGMSVIYRIAVTIGTSDGPATMTAEWVPEAAKPIANVKRTRNDSIKPPSYDTAIIRRRLP